MKTLTEELYGKVMSEGKPYYNDLEPEVHSNWGVVNGELTVMGFHNEFGVFFVNWERSSGWVYFHPDISESNNTFINRILDELRDAINST